MWIHTIFEVLKQKKVQYEYSGPEQVQVYGVQLQNGSYPYLEGILYMQKSISYPMPPKNMCVIAGGLEIYDILQRALLKFTRKESLLSNMQEGKDRLLVIEAKRISEIMENPCILLREDYKVFSWYGFEQEDEFKWLYEVNFKALYEEDDSSEPLTISFSNISQTLMMNWYINRNGKKRYCIVVERDTEMDEIIDSIFLRNICNILHYDYPFYAELTQSTSKIDFLLKKMIEEPMLEPTLVRRELRHLGWIEKEKYYLLAIDFGERIPSMNDVSEFSRRLNARVFIDRNYCICVLTGTAKEEYDSRMDLGINDYLIENNLYAGLSYGFFDITRISNAYTQAIAAIKTIYRILKDVHYYAFADSVISFLVMGCNDNGDLSIKSLCHPTVQLIEKYDKEYGTDYLKFLAIYIYSGCSVKKTAETMFIHKNTVYQKIEKLKEIFNLNLDDMYIYIKLYVSMVVVDQMNVCDANDFLRWM